MKAYLENSLFPSETDKSTILERAIGYIILLSVFTLVLETEPTLNRSRDISIRPKQSF